MKMSGTIGFGAAGVLASALPAAAQSFSNPGFETGSLGGWTVRATANNSGTAPAVRMKDIDGAGPLPVSRVASMLPGSNDGLTAGYRITQRLRLTADVDYTVSVDWRSDNEGVAEDPDGGTFSIILGTDFLYSFDVNSLSAGFTRSGHLQTTFAVPTTMDYDVGVMVSRVFTAFQSGVVASVDNITITGGNNSGCGADFNGDGFIDFFDFTDFVDCFNGLNCPTGATADFNSDGFVDFFDFTGFVDAFELGC